MKCYFLYLMKMMTPQPLAYMLKTPEKKKIKWCLMVHAKLFLPFYSYMGYIRITSWFLSPKSPCLHPHSTIIAAQTLQDICQLTLTFNLTTNLLWNHNQKQCGAIRKQLVSKISLHLKKLKYPVAGHFKVYYVSCETFIRLGVFYDQM